MTDRCEPPPELLGVSGWHWLALRNNADECWQWRGKRNCWATGGQRMSAIAAASYGYSYIAPVTRPEEVAALRAQLARCETACFDVQRDNITMRAENARLREALAALMSQFGGTIAVSDSDPRAVQARAALEEPK